MSHRDSAAPAARGHRPALERLVLDKTGLTGCYDFELDYGDADPGGRGGSGTADRAEIADSEGSEPGVSTIDRAQRVPVGN
ncbi:MAG TPA: DUF3738 domain-containing protein [Candidatus Solibacter sp.]|nr:DUF3738 domain-containing protein [Candidatus Solibacter sp.]